MDYIRGYMAHDDISDQTGVVYNHMKQKSQQRKRYWFTKRNLCKDLKISTPDVNKALNVLERDGKIVMKKGGKRGTIKYGIKEFVGGI